MIVGHGPHQLRGVEVHRGGIILHSLGNFLFPYEPLASRAADVFDAGVDLYALALGAVDPETSRTPAPLDASAWWERIVALATFENGALRQVRLHPIDLGLDMPLDRRGTPRIASEQRGVAILERLAALSRALDTHVRIEGGVGYVDLPASLTRLR